jgi:hypothetical protein
LYEFNEEEKNNPSITLCPKRKPGDQEGNISTTGRPTEIWEYKPTGGSSDEVWRRSDEVIATGDSR